MTTYARIVNDTAVDVSTNPSAQFAPAVAAQFVVVPDGVAPQWVRLAEIVNEATTANTVWKPPGTYVEEYLTGKFRYATRAVPAKPTFGALSPTRPRLVARYSFRQRFTLSEKVALELAAVDVATASTPQRQLAAALRANMADQRDASYIDLDLPATRAGVQSLEDAGLIAPGRTVQIIDAPVQDFERYTGPV